MRSADYRGPSQVPAGPVVVVGGGNSGRQIAAELAPHHYLVIGSSDRVLRRAGVRSPRVVSASAEGLTFADGTGALPSTVVWATGFRRSYWAALAAHPRVGAARVRPEGRGLAGRSDRRDPVRARGCPGRRELRP